MTELKFTCPNCEDEVKACSSLSGKETNCPSCECPIVVPYPEIEPGMVIGGFRVKKKIGAGGMGEVWLAEQLSMDRFVALKILAPTLVNDEEFVESFMHEIKIAAKLSHPNIITAHDAGEENGLYFLASTFVSGDELQVILDTKRRLPERQALKIARAIARALQYAWDKYRIIHRDVKPGNIMIDRDNNVKLMDMGISKSVFEHEALTSGTAAGTPNYMSPEQARDLSGMDFRTDIYSLGVTLFRCLSGRMPFSGQSTEEIVRKHIQEIPPALKDVAPEVSDGTSKLVAKMLEKDRFHRQRSWQEVVDDIDNILLDTADNTQSNIANPLQKTSTLTFITVALATVAGLLFLVHKKNMDQQRSKVIVPVVDASTPEEPNGSDVVVVDKEPVDVKKSPVVVVPPVNKTEITNSVDDTAEILEEDRLLLEIEGRVKTLKTERQLQSIRQELNVIRSFPPRPANLQKITMLELDLDKWAKNSQKKTMSNLISQAKVFAKEQKFTKAAELLKKYRGDWKRETAKQRLKMAVMYEDLQREKEQKVAIEKKHKKHALSVELAEAILNNKLSEAEAVCMEIKAEESMNFSFDVEETLSTVRQIGVIDHMLAEYLKDRVGKKLVLEFSDGTKKRLLIEEVEDGSFSASKKIGSSSITTSYPVSDLSIAQRIKMLPVEISEECKSLYQALGLIQNGSIKGASRLVESSGSISTLLLEYLEVRTKFIDLMASIDIKSSTISDKTAMRVSRLTISDDSAAKLFLGLLDFRERYPLYHTHPLYEALILCAETNFPLDEIFNGEVSNFNIETLEATLEYDFSNPEQENDFEVYKPVTMGQTVDVKDGALVIACRRHGSLMAIPKFKKLEAKFEGSFRLRDFNHGLVSKQKNIVFVGNGFGKYNSDEKDGVIHNWKLANENKIVADDSLLVAGISNVGSLKWDGEVIQFSINNQKWTKQIFLQDEAQFAMLAFGTTNSYTSITLKGQLSEKWLKERVMEIISEK